MMTLNEVNQDIVDVELAAMKQGKEDVRGNFRESISKTNENGLPQAVWAYRSDYIEHNLAKNSNVKTLHIKRGTLWQIDPVLDLSSGVIYIPMTAHTMDLVRRRCQKNHRDHHYGNSFNFINGKLTPLDGINTQQELLPLTDEEKKAEDERKEMDLDRMLQDDRSILKQAIFIVVEYVEDKPIDAELQIYNKSFELAEQKDVSDRLFQNDSTGSSQVRTVKSDENKEKSVLRTKLQLKSKSDKMSANKKAEN